MRGGQTAYPAGRLHWCFTMDENLQTAWNLYRALSTYDYPQGLVCAARKACGSGFWHHYVAGHARYIVRWHNLDTPQMQRAIGNEGIDLIVSAFAYDIDRGVKAEDPIEAGRAIYAFDESFMPISFEVTEAESVFSPRITVNPLAYKDTEAFRVYGGRQLQRVVKRLRADFEKRCEKLPEARSAGNAKWLQKTRDLKERVEAIIRERGPAVLEPPGTFEEQIDYHQATKKWPYNPDCGLSRVDWDLVHRTFIIDGEKCLYKSGHETSPAARRMWFDKRTRAYESLPLHARWWAAVKIEDATQAELAAVSRKSEPAVSQAIHALEERHLLKANRTPKVSKAAG